MNDEAKSNYPARNRRRAGSDARGCSDGVFCGHASVASSSARFILIITAAGLTQKFTALMFPPRQLEMYQPKSAAAAAAAQGRKVYETVCGICHGIDGTGKPNQAPPPPPAPNGSSPAASIARANSLGWLERPISQ